MADDTQRSEQERMLAFHRQQADIHRDNAKRLSDMADEQRKLADTADGQAAELQAGLDKIKPSA